MSKLMKTQAKVPVSGVMAPAASHFQTRPFGLETEPIQSAKRVNGGHSFGAVSVHRNTPLIVQPKLRLGPVKDKYEEEADRVADHVVNGAIASTSQQNQHQRTDLSQKLNIQRLPVSSGVQTVPTNVEEGIQTARGGGLPLAESVREPMEHAFGTDFSSVRVHTNAHANRLNQAIHARAFAIGQDLFFRQGEYKPNGVEAQRLLAHELTHIVQQGSKVGTLSSPTLIQRTTGTEVSSWRTTKFTPAVNTLLTALGTFESVGGKSINDDDTLKPKLEAVARELAGHATEIDYGGRQFSKNRGKVLFGKFSANGKTFGADITAFRDEDKGTESKSIQIKTISAVSVNAVRGAVVKAAKQLAGETKSGEKPRLKDQRIIHIVINNNQNPFPLQDTFSVGDIGTLTKAQVVNELQDRLKNWSLYQAFDKVKLVYTSLRNAVDGPIKSITLDRPGGKRSRSDNDDTDLRNITHDSRVK